MPRSKTQSLPVKEISAKLAKDELLRRLESCCQYLQEMDQLEGDPPMGLTEVALSLARHSILTHRDKQVRLYTAQAIADVLRIYAPDAPYELEDLQEILSLFVSQLQCLEETEGPFYEKYLSLLQNLAKFNTFLVRTDSGVGEVLSRLFQTFFEVVSDAHDISVRRLMLDVMSVLLRESEHIPKELVEGILLQLLTSDEEAASRQLAKALIRRTASDLEPYIRQSFVSVLLVGQQSDSEIAEKVYDLMLELSKVDPSTLTSVLPQLEFKLKSLDRAERLQVTKLLGNMFSAEGSSLAQHNPALWKAYLQRFEDIDLSVRLETVKMCASFFDHQPALAEDVSAALHSRCHDIEERVRLQAVHTVHEVVTQHMDLAPTQLLSDLKDRMWDKKWAVREMAMVSLSKLFEKCASEVATLKDLDEDKVAWIPSKILLGYVRDSREDRELVEMCWTRKLVPETLDTKERMERLLQVFTGLDENGKRVLSDILKCQQQLRQHVEHLMRLLDEENPNQPGIEKWMTAILKVMPDSSKLENAADDMQSKLMEDEDLRSSVKEAVSLKSGCAKALAAKHAVTKSLQSSRGLQSLMNRLLTRCSPVLVDAKGIQCLTEMALTTLGEADSEDEEEREAVMHILQLMELLSQHFGQLFQSPKVIEGLVEILLHGQPTSEECTVFRIFLRMSDHPWKETSSVRAALSSLEEHAVRCALTSPPEVARAAVRCIGKLTIRNMSMEKLFEKLISGLSVDNPLLPTILSSLKEVAKIDADMFEGDVDSVIKDFAVKKVLRRDETTSKSKSDGKLDKWCSEDKLPQEVVRKIMCVKLLVNWLVGQDSVSRERAELVLTLLHGLLARNGDLNNTKSLDSGSLAHLRLAAASAFLKLVKDRKELSLSFSDFLQVGLVSQDPCLNVRTLFLHKLHKGLATCKLPLSYLALLCLYGDEEDKALKALAKKHMQFNVDRRRKLAREYVSAKERSLQLQPEYTLPYAVYLLAHHPKLNRLDFYCLDSFKECMWLLLEPLLKEGESHGLLYCILTTMKQSKDAREPDNVEASKRIYAMCDIAQLLLGSKATNAKATRKQEKVLLPKSLFVPDDQSLFHVTDVFLPPDYVTNLQKSMRSTPISRAFGSPQRQSASRPPRTPSSGASNGTPKGQRKGAGKRPKSAKVEQDQSIPSSQDESPLSRRPKSKKNVAMSQKRLPMEELSAITEVSESGHSTHTTLPSSSEVEGGEAAEEPVPKKSSSRKRKSGKETVATREPKSAQTKVPKRPLSDSDTDEFESPRKKVGSAAAVAKRKVGQSNNHTSPRKRASPPPFEDEDSDFTEETVSPKKPKVGKGSVDGVAKQAKQTPKKKAPAVKTPKKGGKQSGKSPTQQISTKRRSKKRR